jgi:hypothetical protein
LSRENYGPVKNNKGLRFRLLEIWILAFLEKWHKYNKNSKLLLFLRLA